MSFKCDQNFTSEAKKNRKLKPCGGGRRGELRPVGVGMFLYVGSFGLFPDVFQCFDTDPSYTTPDSPAAVGGGEVLLLPQCLFCSWNNPVQNQ